VNAWEDGEFEMFDLVEEVGQNFYDVLEIPQESTKKEITQAYRKLSLKLHPDKNPAPDADVKFRQLVGIYEVLKDPLLRESYHTVLVEGLPNWRHPSYYYRRVRKLALWQVTLIVLVIVSVGQYLYGWASYWEKKLSVQEIIDAKLRRTQRTRKAQKEYKDAQVFLQAEAEQFLRKPSLWDVAPFQIFRFGKYMIFGFPGDVVKVIKERQAKKLEEERLRVLEAQKLEEERLIAEERKKPRKRKTFLVPEKPEGEDDESIQPSWGRGAESVEEPRNAPIVRGGLWTDEDISELVKLCSKFPGGTPERWEKISSALGRAVPEVTFMAKKELEKLSQKGEEKEEEEKVVARVKVKTKGGKGDPLDALKVENWSVDEQKALENALLCFPKGSLDRWDKIAHLVPGRSKEECMQRFKYVADLVKKSKEKKKEEEEKENVELSQESPEERKDESHENKQDAEVETTPQLPPTQQQSIPEEPRRGKKKVAAKRDSSSSNGSDQDWCLVDDPVSPE
jgi:DnaJ family protein C protein 1